MEKTKEILEELIEIKNTVYEIINLINHNSSIEIKCLGSCPKLRYWISGKKSIKNGRVIFELLFITTTSYKTIKDLAFSVNMNLSSGTFSNNIFIVAKFSNSKSLLFL